MTALGGVLGHRCPVCAHPSHDRRDHGRDADADTYCNLHTEGRR